MAVLIIFPVFLQTVINFIMLSIGGHGAKEKTENKKTENMSRIP